MGENEHNIKIQVKIQHTENRSIEVSRSKSLYSTEPVSRPRVRKSEAFPHDLGCQKLPVRQNFP